ncbi:MAG: response regulator [Methylacidiphilales bacterium]|nr:response regulator [Candidatus Methylacidiphilales bacterium]
MQRILLVEDEENTAILLQDYLETIGYAVDVMVSGEKFLEKVRSYKPNLILLDIQLVGSISGLDLLATLRKQPDLLELPVVIMTPMGMIDTPEGRGLRQRDSFLQAGANDCLSKPIGIFQLESVLMKYLS